MNYQVPVDLKDQLHVGKMKKDDSQNLITCVEAQEEDQAINWK